MQDFWEGPSKKNCAQSPLVQRLRVYQRALGTKMPNPWKNILKTHFYRNGKMCFFPTPLVEFGQNRGFPRQCRKNVRFFVIWLFFTEKSQGFTSGLWAQKLLAPFCNFVWKNSASGQAEASKNESASPDKSWLESFFAKLKTGQVNFVPSGFWARFWFKIAPQLMKNPHVQLGASRRRGEA